MWLDAVATNIDVGKAIERSPEEIKKLYKEAKKKVGTLNKVVGGVCSSHSFCPSKFSCMGCPAKIPEPEQAEEIVFMKRWALESERQYRNLGLNVEANKMIQVAKMCEKELREIELIDAFRKDEIYQPRVRMEQEFE